MSEPRGEQLTEAQRAALEAELAELEAAPRRGRRRDQDRSRVRRSLGELRVPRREERARHARAADHAAAGVPNAVVATEVEDGVVGIGSLVEIEDAWDLLEVEISSVGGVSRLAARWALLGAHVGDTIVPAPRGAWRATVRAVRVP